MATNRPVVLIMATKMEAAPFIRGLDLVQVPNSPLPVFKRADLNLVISGIGKTSSAMAATFACLTFDRPNICNLGAAGSVASDLQPGDIRHINKVLEPDRQDWKTGSAGCHFPDILAGFETGFLATTDRPVLLPEERMKISEHARLIDMEAAPIVQVCRKFQVPCYIFKYISDTPADTAKDDIVSNIRKYRDPFFAYIRRNVLAHLQSCR